MRTIYKYKFNSATADDSDCTIKSIQGEIVLAGYDNTDTLSVWIDGDSDDELRTRKFIIRGTGHEVPSTAKHALSWTEGFFVWHLFEVTA